MCGISESALLHCQSSGQGVSRHGARLSGTRLDAAVPVDVRCANPELYDPQLVERRRLGVAVLDLVVGDRDADLPRRSTHHSHRQHSRHARGLYTCHSHVSSRTWLRPRGTSRTKTVFGFGPKSLALNVKSSIISCIHAP